MVREYTSEVEKDVKYLLKCSLSPKMEQEDLDIIARDMTINVEEYKDLNELCKEKQKKAVKKYDELIEKVHLIFEDLRNYDDSFSKKMDTKKNDFYDSFIKAMSMRVDACDTDWMGDDAKAIYKALGNKPSIYSSNTEGFKDWLQEMSNGPYEDFYNSINPTDLNPADFINKLKEKEKKKKLYEYLRKNPEDLSAWELMAIMRVLDSCVKEDGEIDEEKFAMVLEGFFTTGEETTYTHLRGGLYEETTETTYEKSDMLTYISECYEAEYYTRTELYGVAGNNVNSYDIISASLQSVDHYYDKLTKKTISKNTITVNKVVSTDEVKSNFKITRDSKGDYHIISDIEEEIYLVRTAPPTYNFSDAIKGYIKNTKKSNSDVIWCTVTSGILGFADSKIQETVVKLAQDAKKTSTLAAEVIPSALAMEVGIQAVYTGIETIKAVNENNMENKQKDHEISMLELNGYADDLGICVCASCCKRKGKDEIFITNSTVNKNELIKRVAYVNYVNKEHGNDKKYSADELLDAYTKLMAGDDSMKEKLDDFHYLLTKASNDFGTYEKFSEKVKTEEGREDKLYEAIGKTIRDKENEKEKNK